MVPVGDRGRLLDWLLEAFSDLPGLQVDFVSGFMATEVRRQYRDITFHHNAEWATTGPVRSLALAPLSSSSATFICYSDVVFRSDTVRRMQEKEHELVVAVDRRWRVRYDGRSIRELEGAEKVRLADGALVEVARSLAVDDADGEFAGLVKVLL